MSDLLSYLLLLPGKSPARRGMLFVSPVSLSDVTDLCAHVQQKAERRLATQILCDWPGPCWMILGMSNLASKLVHIGPKWNKSVTLIKESKCTETDLKKSQICPIWGQSDPIWMPHLT